MTFMIAVLMMKKRLRKQQLHYSIRTDSTDNHSGEDASTVSTINNNVKRQKNSAKKGSNGTDSCSIAKETSN